MGAGASSQQEMEAMLACTFLLGQALNRAFPDIYTLDDFDVHPDKRERVLEQRKQEKEANKMRMGSMPKFTTLVLTPDGVLRPVEVGDQNDSNRSAKRLMTGTENDEDEDDLKIDTASNLDECLLLEYKGHTIAIRFDDLNKPNQDGWTPLHAACHQATAKVAAQEILRVLRKQKANLNMQTSRGPGSFVSKCTALHLSAAYGIEETASALIMSGADIHITNSIRWTAFHEALHRGYTPIVKLLLEAGADSKSLIPPCYAAPQHAQYPLAHACRQGHVDVIKLLLSRPDIAKLKDQQNEHGWAAIHEASFYNRPETVKALLVYGCDVNLKTSKGLRAAELTLSVEIRDCLLELMPASEREEIRSGKSKLKLIAESLGTTVEKLTGESENSIFDEESIKAKQQELELEKAREQRAKFYEEHQKHNRNQPRLSDQEATQNNERCNERDMQVTESKFASPKSLEIPSDVVPEDESELQPKSEGKASDHQTSFRLLGDLPPGLPGSQRSVNNDNSAQSRKKSKKGKRRSRANHQAVKGAAIPEEGVPPVFCCALSGKLMSDPVKTPWGEHDYERSTLEQWLKAQGNVDPITGMPLATCELISDVNLRIEIRDWQLQQTLKSNEKGQENDPGIAENEEDLYDF